MKVLAVDIDLGRVHCWDATAEDVVAVDVPLQEFLIILGRTLDDSPTTVLIECASPHMYDEQRQKKRLSWAIYNSVAVGIIFLGLCKRENVTVLVAPSSKWTAGYNEEDRHALAGAVPLDGLTKDQNHNLMECQAMAWFYQQTPKSWVPLPEYLRCL